MRGSTRKRGATWTCYWNVTDGQTGERKQRSKGGFRTQKLAQAHLATVIVKTNEGGYIEPSKQPFGLFLEREWLPAIRGELRPLTFESYRRIVSAYILKDPIRDVPLRALNAAHLNALYQRLEERGLAVGPRRLILQPCGGRSTTPWRGTRSGQTQHRKPTRRGRTPLGPTRGAPARFASSSSTCRMSVLRRCGASRSPPACDAANCSGCAGRTPTLRPPGRMCASRRYPPAVA
jgi:hypothetical protein